MKIKVYPDADAVALEAAKLIAKAAQEAVAARGKFVMAVSGGKTPWIMLRDLAKQEVPWNGVHIVEVDERIAPEGDPDRNLTHLRESLLEHAPLRPDQIHAMPVEATNFETACMRYALTLNEIAGSPPVLDLVHLGLGPDGHTASLVPEDPVLDVKETDVALTGIYQNRRRMTLTYPIINRSRRVLWLVTGSEKTRMLARLQAGDVSIPAGRVSRDHAVVLADLAAAGQIGKASKTEVA
ncbi:MAG TPA: 6-phosphogluconolactonase [Candidatus Acidoferrales bacterium]|jgi:6-phosphogluconolactonase|nr:6-phosphogluconolactonase [Candidatus Acidoferrales bacterium]